MSDTLRWFVDPTAGVGEVHAVPPAHDIALCGAGSDTTPEGGGGMNLNEKIAARLDELQAEAERDRDFGWHGAYPTTVLRGLAEDRDILARHHELPDSWGSCATCRAPDGHGPDGALVDFPCEWLLSLARRHGIEVES